MVVGARRIQVANLLRLGVRMAQQHWREVKKAAEISACRLMIDMMRTVHGAYAPASERFGTRVETFYIGLCVALGAIDGKPIAGDKIATVFQSSMVMMPAIAL